MRLKKNVLAKIVKGLYYQRVELRYPAMIGEAYKRRQAAQSLKGVKVENARWMGELLSRLSDQQLQDAFRAGGFDDRETALFVGALRTRIRQLKALS